MTARKRDKMNGISTLNLNKVVRPGLERAPTSMNLARPLPIHRLEGKVALIIGGGGKIGIETAGRLLVEGANVALVDIDQESLEGAVPVLKAAIPTGVPLESRLLTIAADATIEADVEACVKKTVQRFGKLDCAVLNAGERDASKSLFDTKEEDYDRIMSTNVKSGEFSTSSEVANVGKLTSRKLSLVLSTPQQLCEMATQGVLLSCAPLLLDCEASLD